MRQIVCETYYESEIACETEMEAACDRLRLKVCETDCEKEITCERRRRSVN